MGKKDKVGVGRSVIKDRGKGSRHGKEKESWVGFCSFKTQILQYKHELKEC